MFCPLHLDVSPALCHLWLCVGFAGPEQVAVILSLSLGLSPLVAVVTLMLLWLFCSSLPWFSPASQSLLSDVDPNTNHTWADPERTLRVVCCVLCVVL